MASASSDSKLRVSRAGSNASKAASQVAECMGSDSSAVMCRSLIAAPNAECTVAVAGTRMDWAPSSAPNWWQCAPPAPP